MGKEHALPDTTDACVAALEAVDGGEEFGDLVNWRDLDAPEEVVKVVLEADRKALTEAGFALVENVNVTPDFFENLCSSPLGLRIWFESHNYPFTVRGEP